MTVNPKCLLPQVQQTTMTLPSHPLDSQLGSLYSSMLPASTPARPDSIILSHEVAPLAPKPCGRSRSSKAFLLLPLPAPPSTTVPPVLQLPVSAYESRPSLCDMSEQAQPPLRMYTLQMHTIGDHDMKQCFRSHCVYLDLVERFRKQLESEVEVGGFTRDLAGATVHRGLICTEIILSSHVLSSIYQSHKNHDHST
ncbi:uncharacterized protein F5891DRAFT_1083308 [Suillus fuscotomentosus]|uniref:Uncharacterized protein n=1 Tax=Suillus fuscotomentosus TaxID=1912939 RepID=A0AAD4DNM9_9AGAM|nr:uncharacterized protein F5891DRAFT_1083308 [Suillus fuscotomentosus]KAG1886371.1 hypothetical protein F5891DRAFT_1083308 [Suillus fuscotomentosus]